MASRLADQISVEELGPNEYVSKIRPSHMGNVLPIAYGGCVLGIATRAACATVPETHHLYSFMGHFLGPTSTEQKLLCTVHRTRDTRMFATRRVEVRQAIADGKTRLCLEVVVDFHVEEPPLLTYSSLPSRKYSGPEKSQSITPLRESMLAAGLIDKSTAAQASQGAFVSLEHMLEQRLCPEGMAGQNLWGIAKGLPTTQDTIPMTSRSSAEWLRATEPLTSYGEKTAALSFALDGALAILPLGLCHLWFEDCNGLSTLDFALRIFVPCVDLSNWHLRERKTTAAGGGRHFSESKLWDESGTLVASMTQQCMLRPKKVPNLKPTL